MLEIKNFTTNKIDEEFLQKTAKNVLEVVNKEKVFSNLKNRSKIEISLAIVGNARIRKLNKLYCGKNCVTDVLSFDNKSKKIKKFTEAPDGVERLGEIVICYPRAKKQAKKAEHSIKKEIKFLLIHGILHLLGYKHDEMLKFYKLCQKKT